MMKMKCAEGNVLEGIFAKGALILSSVKPIRILEEGGHREMASLGRGSGAYKGMD